jgi:hypothetical protein
MTRLSGSSGISAGGSSGSDGVSTSVVFDSGCLAAYMAFTLAMVRVVPLLLLLLLSV